jgi:hypothetical protein
MLSVCLAGPTTEASTADGTPQPQLSALPQPTPPPDAASASMAWENIMTQGFESSFPSSGWSVTGNPTWGRVTWQRHGGTRSAWCAAEGSGSGEAYENNMDARMTYGPFPLSNATAAELRFWYWISTEADFDFIYVRASHDGVNWPYSWRDSDVNPDWKEIVLGLDPLLGDSSVWIQFQFISDGSNVMEGVYIDDITVRVQHPSDVIAPTISNAYPSTSYVNVDGCAPPNQVTVYAVVWDEGSGVNYVDLWYRTPDGSTYEGEMSSSGSGAYTLLLGPFYRAGTLSYVVRAWDNAGNQSTSSSGSPITVNKCSPPDNTPPTIAVIPASPVPVYRLGCSGNNMVTVRADVTDDGLVSQVWLRYQPPGQAWTEATMASSGGDEYRVTVGPFDQFGTLAYEVRARDASGNEAHSAETRISIQDCPLPAPVLQPIDNADCNGVYMLSWTAVTGATRYVLERATNKDMTGALNVYDGPLTSLIHGGVPAGTYYYWVKACNAATCSSGSNVQSVRVWPTLSSAPVLQEIQNSDCDNLYTVTWSPVEGADGYALWKDDNPNFTSPTRSYEGASTSVNLRASGFGHFYYHVRAENCRDPSDWSEPRQVYVLGVPELQPIDNEDCDGQYRVSWSSIPDATGYELWEDDDPGFGSPAPAYTGAATYKDISGQAAGTYYYQVRATSPSCRGDWSNVESGTVWPRLSSAPVLQEIQNSDCDDLYTVTWSPVAGADGYALWKDDNPDFTSPTRSYEGANTSVNLRASGFGHFYYHVRAENCRGPSDWSEARQVYVLGVPELQPIDNADCDGQYRVSWSSIPDGTGYELWEDDDSDFGSPAPAYTGAATYKDISGQAAGTYYYQVRATSPSCRGDWSEARQVYVLGVPELQPIDSEDCDGQYRVSWSSIPDATGYELWEDDDPGFGSPVPAYAGAASYKNISGKAAGTYYYQVRATSPSCRSDWSNIEFVRVWPPRVGQPVLQEVQNAGCNGDYTLSWSQVTGADRYTLQEADNPGFVRATTIDPIWDTSYTIEGKAYGHYYYRLSAKNPCPFSQSSWSETRQVYVLQIPELQAIANADCDGQYRVSWSSVSDAIGYELWEDDDPGFGSPTPVYSDAEPYTEFSGKAPGTYYYQVRATRPTCTGDWSSPRLVRVWPIPARPELRPIENSDCDGNYEITWSAVQNSTRYELQEDDNEGFSSPETIYKEAAPSFDVSGRAAGTWYYQVRACNCRDCGPWSAFRATTVPRAPTLQPIENSDCNDDWTLYWTGVPGAVSYDVVRDTDPAFTYATYIPAGRATSLRTFVPAPGTYYYQVCADLEACSVYLCSNVQSVTAWSTPPAPALAPIDNPDRDGKYTVSWSRLADVEGYELQEDMSAAFANALSFYTGLETASYGSQGPGTWYYQVRARNCRGWGPWSATRSVVVEEPPRNFAAGALEVTQVIQNLDNDMPLVADKPTVVRFYGRQLSGPPANAVEAWLYGSLDLAPLPGSPLKALNPTRRLATGETYDRGILRDSWVFLLPESWTTSGRIALQAVVDPRDIYHDPSQANDFSPVVQVDFVQRDPLCVVLCPVRTDPTTASINDPNLPAMMQWLLAAYPVPDVWYYRGAEVAETKWYPPWNYNPYEVPEDDSKIINALWLLNLRTDDPDQCGGKVLYYGMVHPRAAELHGYAPYTDEGLGALNDAYTVTWNLVYKWPGWFWPAGGAIMAHEMGHNLGLKHVDCGSTKGARSVVGWNPCNIGPVDPAAYYGFDIRHWEVITPTEAGDLMGYPQNLSPPKPLWPSFETYRMLFDSLPGGAGATATSSALASEVREASEVLAVAGVVLPGTNTGSIDQAYRVPDGGISQQKKALLAGSVSASSTAEYGLRQLNATGLLLREDAFDLPEVEDGVGDERPYTLLVPYDPATAFITLQRGGTELDRRTVSAASPTVQVLQPNGGERAENSLTVRWSASDADGDPLHFTVQYSADGGQTWQVLVLACAEQSLTLDDVSHLPGSDQALIRVIASDGVNTGSDTSDRTFAVARRPPQPFITEPLNGTRYQAGEAVLLTGGATDAEDAAVDSASLSWRLDGQYLGSGRQAWAQGLAPGEHAIALMARDSDGQQGESHSSFGVDPLRIPIGAVPHVDGSCDDDAYAMAASLALAPYADGAQATVKLLRSGTYLYACFSGLQLGDSGSTVGVRLDANGSADPWAHNDDYAFLTGQDGQAITFAGNGSGGFSSPGPQGLIARSSSTDGAWRAELRVDLSLVTAQPGTSRLTVGHYGLASQPSDCSWPYGAVWNRPDSWAQSLLLYRPIYVPVVLKSFPMGTPPGPVPSATPTQPTAPTTTPTQPTSPTATPTLPSGVKRVLWDEAHDAAKTLDWARAQILMPDNPDWVYCGRLASDLSDQFELVRNVDATLTTQLLSGYDGVVLPSPDSGLSSDERQALEQYMSEGGGVLFLGGSEWVSDEFTLGKGIDYDGRTLFEVNDDGDYEVYDFATHPAVSGVTRMVTNWGGSLTVSPPAVVLATSPATGIYRDLNDNQQYDAGEPTGPFSLAAAYQSGSARLVMLAGSPFQDHNYDERDNTPLMRAFLRWLTGPR